MTTNHVNSEITVAPPGQKKSCSGECGSCQCKSSGEKSPLPQRDTAKSAEEQGLFDKFVVVRRDGSDALGGKHHGCEYFVLDLNHDPYAKAALLAYADACGLTHPQLAETLQTCHGELTVTTAKLCAKQEVLDHLRHELRTRSAFDTLTVPVGAMSCPMCEKTIGDRVPIPDTEEQAAGMVLLGTKWLEQHAPHRLK